MKADLPALLSTLSIGASADLVGRELKYIEKHYDSMVPEPDDGAIILSAADFDM